MTYTEASKHNEQFNMSGIFKDTKGTADGLRHRWVIDLIGRIGYIKAVRPDAILVYYPIKSFKVSVRIDVQSWDIKEWNKFKTIKE